MVASNTHAQELPKIASNFEVSLWARTTKTPTFINNERNFGQLPVPCTFSHLKYDDPINKPGQAGAAPLHVFFGNKSANANSTYNSLRTSGDGSCIGGPLNRSAFYFPAVMNAGGKVVLPDFIDLFYEGGIGTVPYPRGLKVIFGYDESDPSAAWDINAPTHSWSVTGGSGQYFEPVVYGSTFRHKTWTPNVYPKWTWDSKYQPTIRFRSPQCWDGKNLDSSNHRTHMAYKIKDSSGKFVCPSTHTVMVPQAVVTAYFKYDNRTDVDSWYLSSDKFGGKNLANGTNLYIGMIPAWDDQVMASWVANILNKNMYGSFGKLGDGRILEKPPTSKSFAPTSTMKPHFLWNLWTNTIYGAPVTSNNNIVDPPAP